jgi:hypothetical protein
MPCTYLYLFIYYGAQTRFPHQMMFVSLNSNTTGAISGTEVKGESLYTHSLLLNPIHLVVNKISLKQTQ